MNARRKPRARRGSSPAAVHILLSLLDGERHGYAIKQEVERRTGGTVRLGPGTLYEAIQRLECSGLIRESDEPRDAAREDGRQAQRRYYRLTPEGLELLRAEVAELGRLVDYARTRPELETI